MQVAGVDSGPRGWVVCVLTGAGTIAALSRWVDPAVALADLPAGTRLDDVLDALAVSWTAARWLRGQAETLGDETDARGRPMRIVV